MKTLTFIFVLILLGTGVLVAQSNFHNTHYLDPYNPEFVKGEVLVKFKDEVQVETSFKSGVAKTGLSSVDKVLEPYQTEAIEKVFKETREQRSRKTVRTIRDFKGNEIEVPALFNIYKLKFDTIWDAKQIIEELQKDENIEFAEANYLVYTSEVMESGIVPNKLPTQTPLHSNTGNRDTEPNDPLYLDGSQAYLDAINAPAAWDSVTGDTTQIIAIIDTGVDWDHPDLDDNIWTNWNEIPDNGIDDDNNGYIDDTRGWDYINNDNDPNDDNSHGTHVAGIAAAEGNNGIGICGVAWNARIIPIKMLQSSGSGNSSDFASAIEYASDNGATVINMSLGSYYPSQVVESALANAYAGTSYGNGSMLVAAAGNDGNCICNDCLPLCATMFPAGWNFVLGVMVNESWSNLDPTGPIIYTHQDGYNYEIKTHGSNITSTKPGGNYWGKTGTSMASPIVAGAVALMRQNEPEQNGEEIFAKIIQGANGNLLDIYGSLVIDLEPDLYFLDFTIIDTLSGGDGDNQPDAGETIQLYFTVKNGGGQADSVWSKIRFGEFEDPSVATILDSTSYIGSMSAYSTMTGVLDPFHIEIDSEVVHNRDIVFQYEIGSKESNSIFGEIILTVQNGAELGGFYTSNVYLTADRIYYGTQSIVIDSDDTLFIDPGVTILMGSGKAINMYGTIIANGKKDSLITFSSYEQGWEKIILEDGEIDFAVFEKLTGNFIFTADDPNLTISNTLFHNNYPYNFFRTPRCIFKYCNILNNAPGSQLAWDFQNLKFEHTNVISNSGGGGISPIMCSNGSTQYYVGNNIFNNQNFNLKGDPYNSTSLTTFNSNTYYGGFSEDYVKNLTVYDYFDDSNYGILNIENNSSIPDSESHAIVWKIDINDILIHIYDNPYNLLSGLGVVGAETIKFDVYFNRPMDTLVTPLLSFGVREPYIQHIINDNANWSSDSLVYTAYYTVTPSTGDGILRVRVAEAQDTDHFEIPIEDTRFEFVIQAAGAASLEFYATPGIGKVDLEWPPADVEDLMGYNMYRFYNLTDSTYSDTTLINPVLILDTLYTDFNVIPDTTYHYLFKTLRTSMSETDYSKKIIATPFNAANGDANGDLAVNVLDITTIVSFMLNQNPSPFLFDAADVNYDNDINVLDIIGLVQLINGGKSVSTRPLPEISNEVAYYYLNSNKLSIESKGNVTAMQFKIKEKRKKKKEGNSLEDLRIFSLQQGFEFAYAVVDDHILGILYSLSGRELPEGITALFRFEGVDISEIEITEIFGGDLSGDYVPILKKGTNSVVFATDAELTASPNPFSYSTQINYIVPENGIVEIRLFDMTGAEINKLENTFKNSGKHSINWNGTNDRGQLLKSGIYLLQLKVRSLSGNSYNKEVKVVMSK